MFPDSMADHLSKSAREKQIDFCKSFYSLPGKRIIAKKILLEITQAGYE